MFTAALTDAAYALAEGAAMPSFRLVITRRGRRSTATSHLTSAGDGALTLVGYAGSDGVVAVPVEVDGAPVTAIARTAFAGNCALRELAVPAGVLAIEGGAFANCASLTKVELPDSLEQVSGSLFDGCGALEDVQLNIALESEMADARGYTRRVELPDGRVREVSVRIERPFTDFNVQSGGEWHVTGAIVIDADHAASISGGGALRIDPVGFAGGQRRAELLRRVRQRRPRHRLRRLDFRRGRRGAARAQLGWKASARCAARRRRAAGKCPARP